MRISDWSSDVCSSDLVGSPFAALGAALDSGGHAFFYERLGAHRTLDLIYTGRFLSGEEAVRLGLFSRSLPPDEVLPATQDAARAAASGPTAAFIASKRIVAGLRDQDRKSIRLNSSH